MDWRVKAMTQHFFSYVPEGHRLNYLFQKKVTHSTQLTKANFLDIVSWGTSHIEAIRRHESRPVGELSFYEFGAGRHLIGPLTFFSYGVNRQVVVDIAPLLRPELVNETIANFQRFEVDLHLPRIPPHTVDATDHVACLTRLYGIDYRAPCDARATGLPSSAVDWITSTSTLEHIAPGDITAILRECHRLLRVGGLMSMSIDYADHYSFFDASISEYNFLRYSETMWKLFNPLLHFQNRLRHPDYVRLFRDAQFEIIEERRRETSSSDIATVRQMPIHPRFSNYTPEDLAVRGAYFVLRRRSPH